MTISLWSSLIVLIILVPTLAAEVGFELTTESSTLIQTQNNSMIIPNGSLIINNRDILEGVLLPISEKGRGSPPHPELRQLQQKASVLPHIFVSQQDKSITVSLSAANTTVVSFNYTRPNDRPSSRHLIALVDYDYIITQYASCTLTMYLVRGTEVLDSSMAFGSCPLPFVSFGEGTALALSAVDQLQSGTDNTTMTYSVIAKIASGCASATVRAASLLITDFTR